jgi:adenosylcobyric acid synthase
MTDPDGVEGEEHGLDLLPLETRFQRDKLLRNTRARFAETTEPWSALAGVSFDGYEIRHGRTRPVADRGRASVALVNESGDPIGWQRGSVLGVYAHGLFESPTAMTALFGVAHRSLESVFDGLADLVDARFAPGALAGLISGSGTRD